MERTRAGGVGPVLVAVADPEHVQQLVRTAGDLARRGSGTVRLVTVVAKPHDSPFHVFADETIVREYAGDSRELLARAEAPAGVTVEREVVVASSVARGIVSAVEDAEASALVIGWQGRTRRSDAVLGTTVDRVLERAACDLYVERVGREADGVDSILLPVAGGPHVPAAATAAAAIADRNDARVLVFSVATSDDGGGDGDGGGTGSTAADRVDEGRRAVLAARGTEPAVETAVREAGEATVSDVIVEEAAAHDVVVLGATRQGALRRRLVGSVPGRVVRGTDVTVVLARAGGAATGPLGRLGALLRR